MREATAGVILAGGLSRRMGGGDKTLLPLDGAPILAHVVARLAPQVARLAINANGDPHRFDAFALPVITDTFPGFAGPLAGVLAGMDWARQTPAQALVTVAGDTPFFPTDLVQRLLAASAGRIVVAASGGRPHPTFALWPLALRDDVAAFLATGETLRVMTFLERAGFDTVAFDDGPADPFFNVNTEADLETARRRLAVDRA